MKETRTVELQLEPAIWLWLQEWLPLPEFLKIKSAPWAIEYLLEQCYEKEKADGI